MAVHVIIRVLNSGLVISRGGGGLLGWGNKGMSPCVPGWTIRIIIAGCGDKGRGGTLCPFPLSLLEEGWGVGAWPASSSTMVVMFP